MSITMEQVAGKKDDSCWMVIHGNVYDLSGFLNEHPGGKSILLRNAGKDATEAFAMIHSKDIVTHHLPESVKLIGPCPDAPSASSPSDTSAKTATVYNPHIRRPPISGVLNTLDMESIAKSVLSKEAWAYYSSGADDEVTLRENHAAFSRILFIPRVLVDVSRLDLSTMLFGAPSRLPVYITATALGRLGHPNGEVELTRAAGAKGIIQMMPTLASASLDEMKAASRPGQVLWFQMYVNKSRKVVKEMLERVSKLGVSVVMITVDAPALGKREKDMRVKFVDEPPSAHQSVSDKSQGAARAISGFIDPSLSWKDIPWFKRMFPHIRFVLKGIQSARDALMAAQYKVDGIVVSNHGGRQLDGCKSGIQVLQEVIPALEKAGVRRQMTVLVDGGFRRGSDVVKALCIGADGVGLGRPFLYGMAAYGSAGVERVVDVLQEEMEMNMRLLGARRLSELDASLVDTSNLSRYAGTGPMVDHLSSAVYEGMRPIDSKL